MLARHSRRTCAVPLSAVPVPTRLHGESRASTAAGHQRGGGDPHVHVCVFNITVKSYILKREFSNVITQVKKRENYPSL